MHATATDDAQLQLAQQRALEEVRLALRDDDFWSRHPALIRGPGEDGPALHLAIFIEPYLELLLSGEKTVESRFASRRLTPYEKVAPGDALLLKRTSGPIVGVASVADVWFYDQLNERTWNEIIERFSREICSVDPEFEDLRTEASYGTLVRVDHVRRIAPVPFPKRDRRGWVVIAPRSDVSCQLRLRARDASAGLGS